MIFENSSAQARLSGGALAWQQQSPQFQRLVEEISGFLYNRSSRALGTTERQLATLAASTLQGSIPGFGSPANDFVSVNRALIAGSITPHWGDHGDSLGSSYGTGNVSVTAASQLLKTMESTFAPNGKADLGLTFGLNASQRAGVLAGVLREQGGMDAMKKGMAVFNMGGLTNSEALGKFIADHRAGTSAKGTDIIDDQTIGQLEKMQKGMRLVESAQLNYKANTVEIQDLLEKNGFTGTEIQQVIMQGNGKNTHANVLLKGAGDQVKEMTKGVMENIKELSNLFQTEDVEKISQYAAGMGMGSVFSKKNAANVKQQMLEIAAISEMTGRSPQEVAAERVQISTALSSAYGGRAASAMQISGIANAGIAAMKNGNASLYTKEEATAAAGKSLLNAQNVYSGMIKADAAMGMYGENVTAETRKEYEALVAERNAAMESQDYAAMKRVSDRMGKFAYKNFGDLVNNDAFVKKANAQYSDVAKSSHDRVIIKENIATALDNFQSSSGGMISDSDKTSLQTIGENLAWIFGNDDVARNEFITAASKGGGDKILETAGVSKKRSKDLIASIRALGAGKVSQALGGVLNDASMQQIEGLATKRDNMRLQAGKLLDDSKNFTSKEGYSNSTGQFVAGLLSEDGVSEKDALSLKLGGKYRGHSATENLGLDEGVVTLGMLDQATGMLDLSSLSNEEKKALYDAVGGKDNFNRINKNGGMPAIVAALENKGYILSNAKDNRGRILAGSRKYTEGAKAYYDNQIEQKGLKDAVALLGKDAIVDLGNGNYRVRYKGNTDIENSNQLMEKLAKDGEYGIILRAAEQGNDTAKKQLSDKFKGALSSSSLNGKAAEMYARLAGDENNPISLQDYRSVLKESYGTANVHAFDSVGEAIAEGLLAKADDGKYKWTSEAAAKAAGASTSEAVDKSDVEKQLEGLRAGTKSHADLLNKLSGADKEKPPTRDQMEQLLRLMKSAI